VGVSRRGFLAGAGAVGLAALGGCVLRREDLSQESDALVILSGGDQSEGGMRHELVERRWSGDLHRTPATIRVVGGVADAQRSQMVAHAQSGRTDVDIYNLDVTWTAEFAQAGYLRPLDRTTLDTDGFLDQPLRTCWYDGQLWALPFNSDAGLLYFRSDLVPPEQAPTDWGGIEWWTHQVLGSPGSPDDLVAGYAGQLADYEGLTVNAFEMIWAEHGEVLTGDWRDPRILIESGPVADALRRLARVFSAEDPQLILPESAEFDEAGTTNAFRERKVLFMRNWPVAHRTLGGGNGAPVGDDAPAGPEFDVRRLPGPSVLGGQNLAIAANSTRPDSAQELIEFLTGEDSQRDLFGEGGLPATRGAVYDDPEIVRDHRYAPDLREAIQMARPRPLTPYYSRFSEVFRQGVRHALHNGGEIPDRFADQLANALQGLRR
jgi:multiple sugar transport system substrate-binding protein